MIDPRTGRFPNMQAAMAAGQNGFTDAGPGRPQPFPMDHDALVEALVPIVAGYGPRAAAQQQPSMTQPPPPPNFNDEQRAWIQQQFAGPSSLLSVFGHPRPESPEPARSGPLPPEMQEAVDSRFSGQGPRWDIGGAAAAAGPRSGASRWEGAPPRASNWSFGAVNAALARDPRNDERPRPRNAGTYGGGQYHAAIERQAALKAEGNPVKKALWSSFLSRQPRDKAKGGL